MAYTNEKESTIESSRHEKVQQHKLGATQAANSVVLALPPIHGSNIKRALHFEYLRHSYTPTFSSNNSNYVK